MSKPLFLDTNVVLQFFNGPSPRLTHAISSADRIFIPLASYGELQIGFAEKTRRAELQETKLEQLLSLPNVEVHLMTIRTAVEYSRIYNQLKAQGTPIPINDIWIAAEVFETGGQLYSCDGHFAKIPMLDWIDGRRA